MRSVIVVLALVATGCGGPTMCTIDSDCSGQVCGADDQCYAETDVRSITLTWNVNCPGFENFSAQFSQAMCDSTEDETVGPLFITPLTCTDNTAIVANVPTSYLWVALSDDFCAGRSIPASNTVHFDLP